MEPQRLGASQIVAFTQVRARRGFGASGATAGTKSH
jgi:hypothetical protein